jgi:hypothetical protein
MNDNANDLDQNELDQDQIDEETLTYEVSDVALEAASGMARGGIFVPTHNFSAVFEFFCC